MMPRFALFDFFEEKVVDVGEWKWILDYNMIDANTLSKSTQVIVQWPTNAKVLKSLGKKTIPVNEGEMKDSVAYVLKTGDNLQALREMANRVLKGCDTNSPNYQEKRQRKRNSKYLEEPCSDEEKENVQVGEKKKTIAARNQDQKLSEAIEAELKQLNATNSATKDDVSDYTDSDHDEDRGSLKEKIYFLEDDIKYLKATNRKLNQKLQFQKSLSDILDAVKGLNEKMDRKMNRTEELAGSSLTGKTSNAFQKTKVAKPKLRNVNNIIAFVKAKTGGEETKVKAAIIQLLNTESKRVTE